MKSIFVTLLIGGASGVLLGTAWAKIWAAARTRLAWPEGDNFFRLHLSSNFVIATEIAVSTIFVSPPYFLPSSMPGLWSVQLPSRGKNAVASASRD